MQYRTRTLAAAWFVGVALLCGSAMAQNDTLHGNASESQAVSEMKARLRSALNSGNVAACQREGENLARYRQSSAGKAFIDADLAGIQFRLHLLSRVYDYFRQIQEISARKAVREAYALIHGVQDKLVGDALLNVTMVFVPVPAGQLGQILVEFGLGAEDFLGSYADAHGIANHANTLRALDKLSRSAYERMLWLAQAAKEAESWRTRLLQCSQQFQAGIAVAQSSSSSTSPSPAGGSFTAEKGDASAWSHIRVSFGNLTSFKTEDSPGWRNNGTSFKGTAGANDRVSIKIDITGKTGVSYFDYNTDVLVKASDGRTLVAEKATISKDGGNLSYSASWGPAGNGGQVTVSVSIMGGNPEFFTYFVSGSVRVAPVPTPAVAVKPPPPSAPAAQPLPASPVVPAAPASQAHFNIAGPWTINGKQAMVEQTGNQLVFINEFGQRSRGHFTRSGVVIATDWDGGLEGSIGVAVDGNFFGPTEARDRWGAAPNQIRWKNGSRWSRPGR